MNLFDLMFTDRWRKSDAGCDARGRFLDALVWLRWLPGRRVLLAEGNIVLGTVYGSRGHEALAEARYRRVLQLLEGGRPWRFKSSLRRYAWVAAAYHHLGLLWLDRGDREQAAGAFDRAVALRRELLRLFPKDRENQVYLGGALCNRGHVCADSDPAAAAAFYQESLRVLRQPERTCACSYWDAERESWWCDQLQSMGQAFGLAWVPLAPKFIDHAKQGLALLKPTSEV